MNDTTYDNFQDKRAAALNDWQRHFILPYGNAYNTAYKSFQATIKAQEEADKAARERNLQLALFALSLCGGSILTSVFGSAALKKIAQEVTLDVICRNEMQRAFKVASWVAGNETAQFALGKVWDDAESLIGAQLKSAFSENSGKFPSLAQFAQDPMNVQNNLDMWIRDIYALVIKAGTEINNRFTSNAVRLNQELGKLVASQFFVSAPQVRIDESKVASEIELTFFMKFILDLDYLVAGYWEETGRGFNMRKVITSRKPIDVDPTDRKLYPDTRKYYTDGTNFQTVEYQQVGDIIAKRVNQLHKTLFKYDFLEVTSSWLGTKIETVSLIVLQRAQTTLKRLANNNLTNISSMVKKTVP
jgi:hypothetical protein